MDSKSIEKKLGDILKVDVCENHIADIKIINPKKKQSTSSIVIKFSSRTTDLGMWLVKKIKCLCMKSIAIKKKNMILNLSGQ
jgi:hypothetical protein